MSRVFPRPLPDPALPDPALPDPAPRDRAPASFSEWGAPSPAPDEAAAGRLPFGLAYAFVAGLLVLAVTSWTHYLP